MRNVQVGMQRRIVCALYAMVGPQHLGAVKHLHGFKWCFSWVTGRKRGVICCVPILRQHNTGKLFGQLVNNGDHFVTTRNRQTPAGHETVLHVYDDQYTVRVHTKLPSGKLNNWLVYRQAFTLVRQHFTHHAVGHGKQNILHFHGFNDCNPLASPHFLANLHGYIHQQTRHG